MDAPPTIRRAKAADADTIAPLFDRYRVFYGKASNPAGAREFIASRLRLDQSVIFLALVGGRPAGFTQLFPSFSSTSMLRSWILNDLFVDEGFRRRGVGRALLDAAEHFARHGHLGVALDAKDLELKTARDNDAAQRLYESAGWVREERFLTYLRRLRDDA